MISGEILEEKLKKVREKRGGISFEIYCKVDKEVRFRRHCGMRMICVKLYKVDRSCPVHTHYLIGPLDEYICQCPMCNYTETEKSLY